MDAARLPSRLLALLAAGTFVLLAAGGLVTSYGVGLAVPDWPTTFGEGMVSYDWFESPSFGVFLEHGHRLMGIVVGTITLAAAAAMVVHRALPRAGLWAGLLVAAVVLQGVMGGLRVVELSPAWAIVHGVFGQVFFAATVVLALVTGRGWADRIGPANAPKALAVGAAALVVAQAGMGAGMRHTTDPVLGLPPALLAAHLLGAGAVVAGTFVLVRRLRTACAESRPLVRWSGVLASLVGCQAVLGLAAWRLAAGTGWAGSPTTSEAVLNTAHQATGALVLAAAAVVAALCLARGRTGE